MFYLLLGVSLLCVVFDSVLFGVPSPDMGAARYYGGLVVLALFCLILIWRALRSEKVTARQDRLASGWRRPRRQPVRLG
jgi:hypothetical protein